VVTNLLRGDLLGLVERRLSVVDAVPGGQRSSDLEDRLG
jgi:hypothetical protein